MDVLKPRLMCFCFFTSKRPSGYTHSDTPLKKRMFLIEKRLEGKRVASGATAHFRPTSAASGFVRAGSGLRRSGSGGCRK